MKTKQGKEVKGELVSDAKDKLTLTLDNGETPVDVRKLLPVPVAEVPAGTTVGAVDGATVDGLT